MITASQNLIISRVFKVIQVLEIRSREINRIPGGSDPLRWLNFGNCESESYINEVTLRIPLSRKFFDDRCSWVKDCRSTGMKLKVPSKVVLHYLLPTIL